MKQENKEAITMKRLARITTITLLFLAIMTCNLLRAQQKQQQWNITLQTGVGYIFNTFPVYGQMLDSYYYPTAALRIGYQTTESDHPYAAFYGYPNVGFQLGWTGLSKMQFSGDSHFGSIINFCGFMERDFLRVKRFSLGYDAQIGIGFNRTVYNPDANPLNMNVSSSLLIYAGADLKMRYRFSKSFQMGLSLHIEHYSTGDLSCPNLGLNGCGAILSLRYDNITPPPIDYDPQPKPEVRPIFGEIFVGGGLHKCFTEWKVFGSTIPWPFLVAGGSINYRYLPQMSTGLNIDLNNAESSFIKRVEEADRILFGDEAVDAYGRYSTFTCGLSLIQQFHYGNFTVFGNLGIYLYKRMGLHEQEGLLYQRVGMKYTFPQLANVFVSIDCKAHRFKNAAMMEFTIGKRL